MAATGFHKADCGTCQRKTWHYKEGDKPAQCTDHSPWTPDRRRVVVNSAIQLGSLYNTRQGPTEREVRIANRLDMTLWRHAEEQRSAQVEIGHEAWTQHLFDEAPTPKTIDPDKLQCSFCGVEVDKINSLTEKKPVIRKVLDAYRDGSGEVHLREKITSRSETVHACPSCCLNIRKPIVLRRV